MAQVLFKDKIGELSHDSDIVTLSESILTIGGQQFKTDALDIDISGITTSDERHWVYAVRDGQDVVLVIDEDGPEDGGPDGHNAYKTVGMFRTDHNNDFYAFAVIGVNDEILTESGRNANGEWTRHIDGTQIATSERLEVNNVDELRGEIFRDGSGDDAVYAIPFESVHTVIPCADAPMSTGRTLWAAQSQSFNNSDTTHARSLILLTEREETSVEYFKYAIAYGRWK
jgi:hypothetical protein